MTRGIEVGCLVMVYGLVRDVCDNGKVGVVIKWAEKGDEIGRVPLGDNQYGRLIADGKAGWAVGSSSFEYGIATFSTCNLLRIDDHTEESETQKEEMVV